MPDERHDLKSEPVEDGIKDMEIKSGASSDDEALGGTIHVSNVKEGSAAPNGAPSPLDTAIKSTSHSPVKSRYVSQSPPEEKSEHEEIIGGEITVKMEPGQPPKLARTSSQKVIARSTPLFDNLPDTTMDAKKTFQVIAQCIYAAKYLGSTEHAMECDCAEEWGKTI